MYTGKQTAAEAVKKAAAEWEKITDHIGRDKQILALQKRSRLVVDGDGHPDDQELIVDFCLGMHWSGGFGRSADT